MGAFFFITTNADSNFKRVYMSEDHDALKTVRDAQLKNTAEYKLLMTEIGDSEQPLAELREKLESYFDTADRYLVRIKRWMGEDASRAINIPPKTVFILGVEDLSKGD